MTLTILVTGFGPFPGSPFNPTAPLIRRIARTRRPILADTTVIGHVFPTSYAAVDRELPSLVARYRPDALLMFGLAPRARGIRVETRARNALTALPDAAGFSLDRNAIAPGRPASVRLPTPAPLLLASLRDARTPAVLSRDAGRYLCNYLCWRATEIALSGDKPRLLAFIHVPLVRRGAGRKRAKGLPGLDDLFVAGSRALGALAAATRHRRCA